MKTAEPNKKSYNVAGALFIPCFAISWQELLPQNFSASLRQPPTDYTYRRICLSTKAHVIVYSKPGCHLCEEAKVAIRDAACNDRFTLEEINIETDPLLLTNYQYDIPVITINGVKAFKHRLTSEKFRERILRLG
jgi:glutaredoxin